MKSQQRNKNDKGKKTNENFRTKKMYNMFKKINGWTQQNGDDKRKSK